MRVICFALCLSLFASLIHAAVMPIDAPAQSHQQIGVLDNSIHHCNDNSSQEIPLKSSCHDNNHQCCLNLMVTTLGNLGLANGYSNSLVSTRTSLAFQSITDLIFKPPKTII